MISSTNTIVPESLAGCILIFVTTSHNLPVAPPPLAQRLEAKWRGLGQSPSIKPTNYSEEPYFLYGAYILE
jgi:hypothetical protein